MKFFDEGSTTPANQILDALVKAKLDLYRKSGREPNIMVTFSPYGRRALLHTCDYWLVSQGTIDPVRETIMGHPMRVEPDQEDPFHIWVAQ